MDGNAALLRRLMAVECPDATAPLLESPLVMSRARGSLIYDVEGREYIDLCAGFGVLALGHNPPALTEVFSRHAQAAADGGAASAPPIVHAMGDVYASDAKVELIEALLRRLPPSFGRAALALTGAQAVELAVKTAMLATGKYGFVTFERGYHGLDLGILPLTARADFRAPFQGFLPEDRVATLPWLCDEARLEAAFAALASRGGTAAVVVEPVQGRAGVRPAGRDWLAMLRRVCDRHGVLLIYDEVFTGLGRTGRWTFAADVPCDLLCLGKALGGGLPLSACVGPSRVMEAWPPSRGEALHTGTFFGHPLSCALATATLNAIETQGLVARARDVGAAFLAKLHARLGRHPAVSTVRGEGLMMALELKRPGDGVVLMDRLRARGVVALVSGEQGESLSLTPALNIPEALLDASLDRLVDCLPQ